MSCRYFAADVATYSTLRQALDSAWGYPRPATATVSCLPPPDDCPQDSLGRVCVCVLSAHADFTPAAELLGQALASGTVSELTAAEYEALFPENSPPPLPDPA